MSLPPSSSLPETPLVDHAASPMEKTAYIPGSGLPGVVVYTNPSWPKAAENELGQRVPERRGQSQAGEREADTRNRRPVLHCRWPLLTGRDDRTPHHRIPTLRQPRGQRHERRRRGKGKLPSPPPKPKECVPAGQGDYELIHTFIRDTVKLRRVALPYFPFTKSP